MKLRRLGGSLVLVIPAVLRNMLNLSADDEVEITINNDCIVIKPLRNTAEELLTQIEQASPETIEKLRAKIEEIEK